MDRRERMTILVNALLYRDESLKKRIKGTINVW